MISKQRIIFQYVTKNILCAIGIKTKLEYKRKLIVSRKQSRYTNNKQTNIICIFLIRFFKFMNISCIFRSQVLR